MYSKLAIAATAAVAAGLAYAQNIVVNTPPTLIECQPVQISWTGGAAPFYPRVTQGGQVANTLKTFDMTSSQSLTWTVDQPANTAVTIVVSDSTGATGATDQVTVQSGSTSW